ncbi:RNA-guided endonuclease InsQ/TnpB family protein [Halomarina salina]|uniref:RNA-guided endonuclease InsQ/TnpB family protein n=1 Tax=Halomarina salina TaxID=1872699 RepID=A0ABD5RM73_9EURY|nr:transposase [Halomarina salina]
MRTIRTFEATVTNQRQVSDHLDALGVAASKLWNVARYYIQERWEATGEIPEGRELKSTLNSHERYRDLHSQSSQRVFEELVEAFDSWQAKRQNGDDNARPPGYRKRNGSHPRSTVTFKADGFRHDARHRRVRLSKGTNLKERHLDFILCEYRTRPDIDLSEWRIQQIRAVHKRGEWRLQFVCRTTIDPEPPGAGTAGIDLGISNIAALSFGGESILFPGNVLKQDEYYFGKQKGKCDDSQSSQRKRLDRIRTERRTHFIHTLTKHIVRECVERDIGTVAVGDLNGIRVDDTGETRNWGTRGNRDLHSWAYDRFVSILRYKAEAEGVTVEQVSERGTSATCSVCKTRDGDQRVERGLYVCETCDTVANADVNGAENIRRKVTPNPAVDRSTGWLAQPAVHLFDRSVGRFAPREN